MKTHSSTSVVARLLVSLFAPIVMAQLVGCEQTDVHPGQAQPVLVHLTNPLPKPTISCPNCINAEFPGIDPQPRTQK